MYSNDFINPQKNNSEVVKHVLDTLINIIKRKRGEEHAVSMMSSLLKELEAEHDFLRYIEIQDIHFLERGERVTVMPNINAVLPTEVGKALHIIISR
jgi:ABC-type antimicrobial peptide transport system permease subunit